MPIQLTQGDITTFEADAIVNAANSLLVVGGGVSGAVHQAAGPIVDEACRAWIDEHGQVPPGGCAMTVAGNLPARYIIHAVGPMWHGGASGEAEQLAEAYNCTIATADENGLSTIAFPSLSTGIFGYPLDEAAPVAVAAVRDGLRIARSVSTATFVLFDEETYVQYKQALNELYDG
jgi:O-acetyl-ADP-ribose deacetylase (regulator of RNase III)